MCLFFTTDCYYEKNQDNVLNHVQCVNFSAGTDCSVCRSTGSACTNAEHISA